MSAATVSGLRPGEHDVTVRRKRLRVSIRGEGAPVLLINGLGGSTAMWAALHEDLRDFLLISFDAPGTGHSITPKSPYSVRALAGLVAELLDELGLDQLDVLGYSFGGIVAQQLARDHGARIRRLILSATMCGWGALPGDALSFLSIVTPVRYYSKLAYRLTAPLLAGGAGEASPSFIERTAAARLVAPPAWRGYSLQLAAAWTWSSLPWLHAVRHPTLVVTGAQDRLVPAVNGELLASRLPNARLLPIDGWGHYVLLDRSSGAGQAIADFLAADPLEDSSTWRTAHEVSDDEARAACRAHRNFLKTIYWGHSAYRWRHAGGR